MARGEPSPQEMAAMVAAIRKAKARRAVRMLPPPGMGTNEAGPKPETNPPANGWPQDRDAN